MLTAAQILAKMWASPRRWPRLSLAAQQYGISRWTLLRLLKTGEVLSVRQGLGRFWVVDPDSLEEWLAQQKGGAK